MSRVRAAKDAESLLGLHRIEVNYQDRFLFQHMLVGDENVLIIDTGVASTPAAHLFPLLGALESTHGLYLLITHSDADHCGGLAALRERFTDLVVMAHEKEAPLIEQPERNMSERYLELQECGIAYPADRIAKLRAGLGAPSTVDRLLQGGESFELSSGWSVDLLATPGHTVGHMSVLDASNDLVIAADACLGEAIPTREGNAAFAPTYRYTTQYRETIEQLRAISPEVLLTSHFPRFEGESVDDFLKASYAFTDSVEQYLLRQLEEQEKVTVEQLIEDAGSQLGKWPPSRDDELWYCLQGGLEALLAQGLARRRGCEWSMAT